MSTPSPTPAPTPNPPADAKPSLRPLILVLAGLLIIVVVLRLMWQEPQPPEGRRVGDLCPEVAGLDVNDQPVKLSDYKGKVVLVSFWATWCGPCNQQLPHEIEMVNTKYKGRPFAMLGVAQDNEDLPLDKFLKAKQLPWANIFDKTGAVYHVWGVQGIPSAVLVDHKGVIRYEWINGISPDKVWAAVDELVAEAERK